MSSFCEATKSSVFLRMELLLKLSYSMDIDTNNPIKAMPTTTLPAITLDYSADGEYTLTAVDRNTNKIVAAAMSYECEVATLRIDLQLIELGIQIYEEENIWN
jgi:hypothetical protein